MNLLTHIARMRYQYRAFEALRAQLARMSDRALSDLGLTRDQIIPVAFEQAERQAAERFPSGSETRAMLRALSLHKSP